MKTLLLVDGSSYLYRAFHAMPDLRSPSGEPTGAIHGVLNMLRRLQADYPADYSACVFDAKGKTFRDDWYPDYKAHRPAMPDDLRCQIEPLLQMVAASGWNVLAVEGVEADDVIGTLAQQAAQAGSRCIISTGDKDLAQLVNPLVMLINTMSNEVLDEAGVIAKFGVEPARIVDYLALVGDAVDNVPGVSKCGPKTALKWLGQFGTLDQVMLHATEIGGVVGESLRSVLDWLPQARRLLTVKCDVALPARFDALVWQDQDKLRLKELFGHYGLKTLLHELDASVSRGRAAVPASEAEGAQAALPIEASGQYETILTEAQLDLWLDALNRAPLACLDTETTGLDVMNARLVGISFAVEPHRAAYLPLAHHFPGAPTQLDLGFALERLKPWLENPEHKKLGQNLKYDQHILANHGVRLAGVADDTLLQSYVLESHRPHDMDNLALRHLGVKTISYAEVVGKGAKQIGFDQVDLDTATRYAAEDADITLQLHHKLAPQLQGGLAYIYREIELPSRAVLWTMERNGVLLDSRLLGIQSRELGEKLLTLESHAHAAAGQPFNLNSPKQIQEILFDKLGLPVKKKTPSGTPSTDEEVLQELALDYPLPKLLLEYRGLAKLKSTYTDKLPLMINPATGRVHTNYAQAVAVTGRLSSNDPNLQNIPVRTAEGRRIREAFIAPAGHKLISADYSQIELRIMAHLSGDPGLLDAFARGQDIHRATAAEIFGVDAGLVSNEQRRQAKVINFGLIYGMSVFGLAGQLNIERSAAQAYMDRYFARYPGVADYMQRTRLQAKQLGYVETVFGRRLWLPEIGGANGMRRQAAERAAINAPMQGTAADLIKLAMVAVQRWLDEQGSRARLIMQVHDELVLEVPDGEVEQVSAALPGLMCQVGKLRVPLTVSCGVGANWEAAH
ncbi:DNA polymerase I [Ferriphaselus sp. R-1]|uniref:DNA polymerase I n=1 Tax=Ferriphaselus sp. R-1 TaxID=1485544 RepID=UPI00054F40D9|nr:DNA polymerase I [Ferriphaselus sp. R-1]